MFQMKNFDLIADNNTTTKFQNLSIILAHGFQFVLMKCASPQVQSSIMTHRLYKEHLNHF